MFVMLCGIAGSGKSSYAEFALSVNPEFYYVSSDKIRGELYKDEACQKDPKKVFRIAHERVLQRIHNKQSVIFDATNLRRAQRVELLQKIKKEDPNCICAIKFFGIDPQEAIARQANRARKVPAHVIWKQFRQLEIPIKAEGWDFLAERRD